MLAIALAQDDLVDRRGWLIANVGDLDWLALCCRRPNIAVAKADMLVADCRNHGFAHAVGGVQAKLLALLVEHVDRAGIGARQLYRPADDGGEDCFEIQRRVHRLADLAERLQFPD